MWGIHSELADKTLNKRITPTYVGNTTNHNAHNPIKKDHPHVCGEYMASRTEVLPWPGSPPRMWGILFEDVGDGTFYRITPTYVGNTSAYTEYQYVSRDHPHVCGEYLSARLLTY